MGLCASGYLKALSCEWADMISDSDAIRLVYDSFIIQKILVKLTHSAYKAPNDDFLVQI